MKCERKQIGASEWTRTIDPTMSRWCSNQLSYRRKMVRSIGLEPTTPTMSRWCSNQLSYERIVLSVTTGTNISGTAPRWQEGKCIFL